MAGRDGNSSKGARALDPKARERIVGLVAAYGANPEKWPAGARELAPLRDDAIGRDELELERALDRWLSTIPGVDVPEALRVRLAQDFQRESQNKGLAEQLGAFVWPGAPWWKPACALSISLLIGLSIGFAASAPLLDHRSDERAAIAFADTGVDLDQGDEE
jgi:hypothetical protein